MTVMSAVADACSGCIVEFEVKALRVMATARGTRSFICLTVPEHHPALVTKAPLVLTRSVVVVWQKEVVALGIVTAASRTPASVVGIAVPEHGEALVAEAPLLLPAQRPGMFVRQVEHPAGSRVFAAGWTSPFGGGPIKEHGVTLSAKTPRSLAPVTGDERQRIVAAVTLEAQ